MPRNKLKNNSLIITKNLPLKKFKKRMTFYQNNYFFVDFLQKSAFAYVECTIKGAREVIFNIGMLEIEEVRINDVSVKYEIEGNRDLIDACERSFKKDFFKEVIDYKNTLRVKTENGINNVKIEFVPNVKFNEHYKEMLGSNEDTVLFPYINVKQDFKLTYVIPQDFTVISPGQVVSVAEHNEFIVHTYRIETLPENISFIVGIFEAYEISAIKTLYLPSYIPYFDIKTDSLTIQKFLDLFFSCEQSINLSLVFSNFNGCVFASNLAIIPFSSFPMTDDIILNFRFKERLAGLMSMQLFVNIIFEKEDRFLREGLIGYVRDHILKNLFGTNRFMYNLKNDVEYIVGEDCMHQPLYSNRTRFSYNSRFLKKKATVFFHILENNTSLAFMQKIIKNMLNREIITTQTFISLVRDVTGKDLKNEKLIYKNSCAKLVGELNIDLKKNQVKIAFNSPVNTIIQSHEVEGIFEHRIKKEMTYTYHNRRKRDEESVLFIKIDPYLTQLNTFKLMLKNNMYNNLTKDKNILSQMEGVKYVNESELERLIYDVHVNYRVKLMAMKFLSLNSLLSFFVKKFCVQGSTIIKSNSFTVLNHQMLLGLMRILSFFDPNTQREINNSTVSVGNIIKAFYYNILRYNDNSTNQFDDSSFITEVIKGLSFMITTGRRGNYEDEINNGEENVFNEITEKKKEYGEEFGVRETKAQGCLDNEKRYDFEKKGFQNTDGEESGIHHKRHDGTDTTGGIDYDDSNKKSCKKNFGTSKNVNEPLGLCEEIYLEIIERYRMKDLLFPSNENRITCAILYFYGRLDLYGIIDMNLAYLIKLMGVRNFINVRLIAAEILTFKIILDEENAEFYSVLDFMLNMEDEVRIVVLSTIINLLSSINYNTFVKGKFQKFYFFDKLRNTESSAVKDKVIEIIYFLENMDVALELEQLGHELSSSESEVVCLKLKVDYIKDVKVKLRFGKKFQSVKRPLIIKKIVPMKKKDGVVKLKVKERIKKRTAKKITVTKRTKLGKEKKFDFLTKCVEETEIGFTDPRIVDRVFEKYGEFSGVKDEKTLRAFLTQMLMNEKMNSEKYALANKIYSYLESLKLEIPLENKFYTLIDTTNKNKIKSLLDTLSIPQFPRQKSYKDITRKPKTVYSLKKKLEGIVVLETFKSDIADFIEKSKYFTGKQSFNEKTLLSFVYSIQEAKNEDVFSLLLRCFDLLTTKKMSSEFMTKATVEDYDTVVTSPMYLELVMEKIRNREYRSILDIQKDMELIRENAVLFNGEKSIYALDANHLLKWFKRIVGGMLGDLYNDAD